MKNRYILIMISILQFSSVSGQVYHPFPTDSATWSVEEYYWATFPAQNGCIARHYGLVGDTVINSLNYSKLYGNNLLSNFPYFDTSFNFPTATYLAAVREDPSKKVWIREPNDTTDQLYYDFSLNVGDTFCFNYFNVGCYPVVLVDSIFINGGYRRQIHFTPFNTETWIEGIGSTTGWFQWQYTGSWSYQLLCYKENQIQLYGLNYCHCDTYTGTEEILQNPMIKIGPNPATNTVYIYSEDPNSTIQTVRISSILGLEIMSINNYSRLKAIDISNMSNGIYMVTLTDKEHNVFTRKLIKNAPY